MSASFPLPDPGWEPTREFWAGAARRALRIPRCRGCQRYVWYPQPACNACGSAKLEWSTVSGRGRLYSWTVVHRAFVKPFAGKIPYVSGLVALDEAPYVRIVTNLVDCDPAQLAIDQPVQVVFRPLTFPDRDPVMAPLFTPLRA